jgi:FKBP-type peptidyl-prolyl cis-trans isomerase FkpA
MLDYSQQVYEDYKAGNLDDQLQTTPSGLRYVIHEEGSGKEAEAGRGVVVQYIGRLSSNGEVFDQSFERGQGIPFPLGQGRVIPGWDEGIDLLQEGDRATFIIPSELAYGEQGSGATIPPGSELLFYVELEKVQ